MLRRAALVVFVLAALAGLVVTLWPTPVLRGVGDVEFQFLERYCWWNFCRRRAG